MAGESGVSWILSVTTGRSGIRWSKLPADKSGSPRLFAFVGARPPFSLNAPMVGSPGPRYDVQPLEWDLATVVAETEPLRRAVEPLERRVDFVELARGAGRIRFVELLVHGVRSDVGGVQRHQRQVARGILFAGAGAIGENSVQQLDGPVPLFA